MTLHVGDQAPNFNLPADGGEIVSLSDYKGQKLVIYFYPKDDTPGCTKQACGFTENLSKFNDLNCAIVGVSKDSVTKHEKFKTKHNLNFPLLSDENSTMCEDYGVWKEKSMYGKTYMGIERTTYLLDENGTIQHVWNKVKVPGHIEAVMEAVEGLGQKAA